jgi:hypothetical protein
MHENFHTANVTSFNPLNPGNLLIALRTGKQEVILGEGTSNFNIGLFFNLNSALSEVITMYSKGEGKGSKHEWIPSAPSVGVLSYIYVTVFKPFAGNNMFSSMTCPSLSSSTILQVPRTHVLFSLASSAPKISSQKLKTTDGHPFSLVTLDTYSATVFEALHQHSDALYDALVVLQKGIRLGMDQMVPEWTVHKGQNLAVLDPTFDSI